MSLVDDAWKVQSIPHSPKKRPITLRLQHLFRPLRKRIARALETLEAGIEVYEGEFEVEAAGEGFEQAAAGGDDFFADAIAGDKSWVVGEWGYWSWNEGDAVPMRRVRVAMRSCCRGGMELFVY